MKTLEITDSNFAQEVKNSDVPVLLDFWAVWCGPCKNIGRSVDELAVEYGDKIKMGKVDIDNNPDISVNYGIRSVPMLLFFKDGQVVDQIVGNVSKQAIASKLDEQLETA